MFISLKPKTTFCVFSRLLLQNNKEIIIEEKIEGDEVSILGFCNGSEIELMPQTQDYKKLYDSEIGPNTGGMGFYFACSNS